MNLPNFSIGNLLSVVVFLLSAYSTTLNIIQGLNGLYCFSAVNTKTSFNDKAVSTIILSGFSDSDGIFSNYVNNVSIFCRTGDDAILNLRKKGSYCNYKEEIKMMVCRSSSKRTNVEYTVDCTSVKPPNSQAFELLLSPNGIGISSSDVSKGWPRATVYVNLERSVCLLNRGFYVVFVTSFLGFSLCFLILILWYSESIEIKSFVYRNLNWLDRYLVKNGFINHCSPFSSSILQNYMGLKCWRLSEVAGVYLPEEFLISEIDEVKNLEHFEDNQNYTVIRNTSQVIFMHNDFAGYQELTIDSKDSKKIILLYNYTLIKCRKQIIDYKGHYPSLYEMNKLCIEFKFLKGREGVNNFVSGVSVGTVSIETGIKDPAIICHFYKFWKTLDLEVLKKALKGDRMKPESSFYKNTQWKLYLSDLFIHLKIKETCKIKKFMKSSILKSVELMSKKELSEEVLSIEISDLFDPEILCLKKDSNDKTAESGDYYSNGDNRLKVAEFFSNFSDIIESREKTKVYEVNPQNNPTIFKDLFLFMGNDLRGSPESYYKIRNEMKEIEGNILVLENVKGNPKRKFTQKDFDSLDKKINNEKHRLESKGKEFSMYKMRLDRCQKYLFSTEETVIDSICRDIYMNKTPIIAKITPAAETKENQQNSSSCVKEEEGKTIVKDCLHSLKIAIRKKLTDTGVDRSEAEKYIEETEPLHCKMIEGMKGCFDNKKRPGIKSFRVNFNGKIINPIRNRGISELILPVYKRVVDYRSMNKNVSKPLYELADPHRIDKGKKKKRKAPKRLDSELKLLCTKMLKSFRGGKGKGKSENDGITLEQKEYLSGLNGYLSDYYQMSKMCPLFLLHMRLFCIEGTGENKKVNREKMRELCEIILKSKEKEHDRSEKIIKGIIKEMLNFVFEEEN